MPYNMRHRRRVDEFKPLPFFGMSARNIAYGGAALALAVGTCAAIYLTGMSEWVMAVGSFVLMFVCGPLALVGFKNPKDGFTSYEEKAYLYLRWRFALRDACFHSDSIYYDEEGYRDAGFEKRARRSARREREKH